MHRRRSAEKKLGSNAPDQDVLVGFDQQLLRQVAISIPRPQLEVLKKRGGPEARSPRLSKKERARKVESPVANGLDR